MSRPGDVVSVWLIAADQPVDVVRRLTNYLDTTELQRAISHPDPNRRAQYVVAHGALREIVGSALGVDPAGLRWIRGPEGKPELAEGFGPLRFNLSTGGAYALVAVTGTRGVGVDIEPLAPEDTALRLAERYFLPAEARRVADGLSEGPALSAARFTVLWSRKEAAVKARGGRLAEAMLLPVEGVTPLIVRHGEPCVVRDVSAPAGYRAAAALEGSEPFHLESRVWSPDVPDTTFAEILETKTYAA